MYSARTRRALILLLAATLAVVGCGRRRAELGEEPKVTVVINPDTGEKKTLPIEEYVKGVVGGEMGRLPSAEGEEQDWPENAYAAQAILARSFTMEYLSRHPDGEISTDVEEAQAYNPDNITPVISKAVDKTRGEVLMEGDSYVTTWFHSYSGGRTADAAEGLNYTKPERHTRSVELPANEYVPEERRRWTTTVSLSEITQALAAKGIDVGQVSDIRVNQRGPSGRITELGITGTSGATSMHGAEFRLAVGAEKMQSTLVDQNGLTVTGKQVTIRGMGFGHGVGMSQWDAYKMAKEGRQPAQIVLSFFQNVSVQKRWK
ncbi:MAG: SpoIID/LytB domain-containing protein [Limnochordia bacterium]|jgi:stage II sporulation protein D